jgi:hypothetical protein
MLITEVGKSQKTYNYYLWKLTDLSSLNYVTIVINIEMLVSNRSYYL